MNNKLTLKPKIVTDDETFSFDNIEFSQAIFIQASVDGTLLNEIEHLRDSLLVFPELKKSLSGNGRYLLFTSANGIADSGGWNGVEVRLTEFTVTWTFSIDEIETQKYQYEFKYVEYLQSIIELEKELRYLQTKYVLEPSVIIFPEDWN